MKKYIPLVVLLFMILSFSSRAQQAPADTTFKPGGKLWGYSFGDYYYKAHSDVMNRGGSNQYTGIEKGRNAFQFRRIYLGYNYDIAKNFSAELLLAAEDNTTTSGGATSGDLLTDNKLSYYIKLANIRWKNIWKGTDLVLGQLSTPAFSNLSEPAWGYRSIEKTILDRRRTPSYDLGAALQGKFDPATGNYGYDLMVGNGNGAKPENDKFKWFYGDVYGKFLDKKLTVQLYADYMRLNWQDGFHHSRNMFKVFAGYTVPTFSFGAEAFINHNKKDVVELQGTNPLDTLNAQARGISVFSHYQLVKDKLRIFARADQFNPYTSYADHATTYKGLQSGYEPNNKELFITTGLDFTPIKNVHLMPNIWYTRYTSQDKKLVGNAYRDYDLVYRLTFYYTYGK